MMKTKTCKVCGEKFFQRTSLQVVCSVPCSVAWVKQQNEKRERKVYREKKEKLKSLTEHIKEAQSIFNRYIRERDKGQPCISCGRTSGCQFHAGHYRTTKAASHLRFNEDNVHIQCAQCNNHLSGNITEYRINLVKKIGIERVEALENNNQVKRYTIDEVIEIKNRYKNEIKKLLRTLA